MEDYRSYADELVEKIDDGELDPIEVDIGPFVEDDTKVLTQELAGRLPDSKIEEYNERVHERDHAELMEERREQEAEYQDAIDAIKDPTVERTETVTLNETDLKVKNHVSGEIESKLSRLARADSGQTPTDDVAREIIVDVMTWFIKGPEPYNQAYIWREYAAEYGTQELIERAMQVARPYFDRQQELNDTDFFRNDE